MKDYFWLGEPLEQRINILSIFQIDPKNYELQGDKSNTEEARLRHNIKENYRLLQHTLHPAVIDHLPDIMQKQAISLAEQVTEYLALLIDSQYYQEPLKNGRDGKYADLKRYTRTLQNSPKIRTPQLAQQLHYFFEIKKELEEHNKIIDETTKAKETLQHNFDNLNQRYSLLEQQHTLDRKTAQAELQDAKTARDKYQFALDTLRQECEQTTAQTSKTNTRITTLETALQRHTQNLLGTPGQPDYLSQQNIDRAIQELRLLRDIKEYNLALNLGQQIIQHQPQNHHAHYFLATIYEAQQELTQALTHFQNAGTGSSAKQALERVTQKLATYVIA